MTCRIAAVIPTSAVLFQLGCFSYRCYFSVSFFPLSYSQYFSFSVTVIIFIIYSARNSSQCIKGHQKYSTCITVWLNHHHNNEQTWLWFTKKRAIYSYRTCTCIYYSQKFLVNVTFLCINWLNFFQFQLSFSSKLT